MEKSIEVVPETTTSISRLNVVPNEDDFISKFVDDIKAGGTGMGNAKPIYANEPDFGNFIGIEEAKLSAKAMDEIDNLDNAGELSINGKIFTSDHLFYGDDGEVDHISQELAEALKDVQHNTKMPESLLDFLDNFGYIDNTTDTLATDVLPSEVLSTLARHIRTV